MKLTTELEQIINEALLFVENDEQHQLLPIYRLKIYNAFGSYDDPLANKIRGWLALLSAEYVLPLWKLSGTLKNLPHELIQLTREKLLEQPESAMIYEKIEKIRVELERLDDQEQARLGITSAEIWTGETALRAFYTATGNEKVLECVDETTTDQDTDYWDADAADFAALAVASGTWEADSNPSKRLEFWEWWLKEAIPEALQLAQKLG